MQDEGRWTGALQMETLTQIEDYGEFACCGLLGEYFRNRAGKWQKSPIFCANWGNAGLGRHIIDADRPVANADIIEHHDLAPYLPVTGIVAITTIQMCMWEKLVQENCNDCRRDIWDSNVRIDFWEFLDLDLRETRIALLTGEIRMESLKLDQSIVALFRSRNTGRWRKCPPTSLSNSWLSLPSC